MSREGENIVFDLRNAFRASLLQLPRGVRAMPVREFVHAFQGDVASLQQAHIERAKLLATPGKKQ